MTENRDVVFCTSTDARIDKIILFSLIKETEWKLKVSIVRVNEKA